MTGLRRSTSMSSREPSRMWKSAGTGSCRIAVTTRRHCLLTAANLIHPYGVMERTRRARSAPPRPLRLDRVNFGGGGFLRLSHDFVRVCYLLDIRGY